MCHKDKGKLKGTGVLKYIKWGEKQGFHKRPTCRGRQRWWDLGVREFPNFVIPCGVREIFKVFKNTDVFVDKRLYEMYGGNIITWASCNSTLYSFLLELKTRNYGGGGGPIDATVYEINNILVIDINDFTNKFVKMLENILTKLSLRKIYPLFTELGINPNLPIRSQEPNPLPDRKALDDIIFDILGLTEDERKEVYWAVCELVKNRLEKARSV